MKLQQKIAQYNEKFEVVGCIDLDQWYSLESFQQLPWLQKVIAQHYQEEYANNQRLVFVMTRPDTRNILLNNLITCLNQIDISNFFVVILTTNTNIDKLVSYANEISLDLVPLTFDTFDSPYQYNSAEPVKVSLNELSRHEGFLLSESKTFCIYPWIHLHAYPTGAAYPCCHSEMKFSVGDVRKQTLKEVWNSAELRQLRIDMLTETSNQACTRCYEQENSGFFSGRKSANKHHGHHIKRVANTKEDGHLDQFEMTYWDIRFSNLCNLSCRSCGHIFSSSWYQDQVKLAGSDWKEKNKVLNYAGRTETDIWEQLIPHLDYVEQIYFAGGEPL
jgi:radical SAM protein with 4Fe4S-binding SPASM domain